MKLTSASMIAAVAAIGAAGFFISRSLPSPDSAAAGDTAASAAAPARTSSFGRGGGGSSAAARADIRRQAPPNVCADEVIARMEAIIRGEDAPDRNRTLLRFIDQLGPAELEDASTHFRSLGRSDSRFSDIGMLLAARAVAAPLVPLAPSGAPHLPGHFPGNPVVATAPDEVAENPQRKFPDAFYRGKNSFPPSPGTELNAAFAVPYQIEPPMFMDFAVTNFSLSSTAATDSVVTETATETPVEADIWRTDGHTVYFFNQLRGLQVLDLSDPADPRLTATLRLPAVGEDLYLLPGSGASRTLVLLTRVTGGELPATRINMVTVTGGVVAITHHLDVPGLLADSRMVGDKLALVTTARSNIEPGNSITSVSQWLIAAGKPPEAAGQAEMQTANPVIAAGADWLALAGYPSWNATHSEVRVFGLGGAGLSTLTPVPVRTAGIVLDKFKLQWRDNVLTTISEKRRDGTAWTVPVTVLENFLVPGRNDAPATAAAAAAPLLGSLELARGERLYATRFAENKAYVVTFRQTDPLWIVDLADPATPLVSGHLEVPGWSTYLEPIGDLLFSVGWESGTLAASLFDVANPASPKLLRRLNLGSSATRSEAAWNEKALKIIPEAGLAMIPFQTFDPQTNTFVSVVQLLDLDVPARDLRRRGAIRHEFDARRSEMIGDAVVSISQKALVAADIADRDAPAVLSDVSLAWPVDRVLEAGAHLLQIESGGSYAGRATVRISPAADTEAILAEFDLGDGRLCAAAVRNGRLLILRDDSPGQYVSSYSYAVSDDGDGKRRLHLDLYDLASLPLLTLAGTCSVELESGASIASDLLWPRPHLPAVVLQSRSAGGRFYPGLSVPISVPTLMIGQPGTIALDGFATMGGFGIIGGHSLHWVQRDTRKLLVFNTTDAAAPTAGEPFAIGTEETVANGVYQAADGLLVMGGAEWEHDAVDSAFASGTPVQVVHVVEIGSSGDPVARPPIDLPGALFAIADLDRDGFLAYTRGADAEGNPTLQVSACDGFDAFEITSLKVTQSSVLAVGGWRLFVADDQGVERFRLSEEGEFVAENSIQLGWRPASLRCLDGVLIGRDQRSLFAVGSAATEATQWPFPAPGPMLGNVSLADDGDLLAPLGDYGVERFER